MSDALSGLRRIEVATGHKTTQNDIGRQIAALRQALVSLKISEGNLVAVGRVELPTPRI
jgi:hypothetical protein